MSVDQGLPGPPQPTRVDDTFQIERHLDRVDVHRLPGEHRVEQQTGLQRREGPHILEVRETLLPAFDFVLRGRDQRQIGRCETTRIRRGTVGRECRQRSNPQRRQFLDVGGSDDSGRISERCAQLRSIGSLLGDGVDGEHCGRRHIVVVSATERFASRDRQPRSLGYRTTRSPEIVETDLRRGQFGKNRPGCAVDVPQ